MRRIRLAAALAGAIASAGCGGSVDGGRGGGRGVGEGTFTIKVQNTAPLTITGGRVTSTPAGIECGAGVSPQSCEHAFASGTRVTLTATPIAPNLFLGWSGDCTGEAECVLTGNADRYLVVQFGTERTGHPSWADGKVHREKFAEYTSGAPGALQCTSCHGDDLQGRGLAVACTPCHADPDPNDAPVIAATISGGLTGSPTRVTLAATDPDRADAITCSAVLASQPPGGAATLQGGGPSSCRVAAQTVSFTPTVDGLYVVRATASDGTVTVTRDVTVGVSSFGGGAVSGTTPLATPSASLSRLIADLALVPSTTGVSSVQAYRAFANLAPVAPPTDGSASTQGPVLAWEARPYDVIDVRDDVSFAAGHIPGAVNVPLQELPDVLLASPWFPASSAATARKVLVAGYSRGDSSLGSLVVAASRFGQGTIPATAAVSYLLDGMATWTVNKAAVPYRWDDDLGKYRFEWTLADTRYVESSPAGTTFTKAGKPTYELPAIAPFTANIDVTDTSNGAAMRRILVRMREWTRWAVEDATARGLPHSEAFVTNWGLYKKLRDDGVLHRVVTNQSDAQWAAERAIGAYRGSGAGSILNPLVPADLALLDPQNLVLYHCFSNGSAVAPCFRMAVLGYRSRTILYGITGAVKRDAVGVAAGHNTFYTGLQDAGDGASDFPLSTSGGDPQSLAWTQPPANGCAACHTDFGALYTIAAKKPSAPASEVLSEGEG